MQQRRARIDLSLSLHCEEYQHEVNTLHNPVCHYCLPGLHVYTCKLNHSMNQCPFGLLELFLLPHFSCLASIFCLCIDPELHGTDFNLYRMKQWDEMCPFILLHMHIVTIVYLCRIMRVTLHCTSVLTCKYISKIGYCHLDKNV